MPNEIDDSVVKIEFDNKKFEKNARKTLSTIDKLKEKLKFKKSNNLSKSFNEDVAKVDISPMETALHKFSLKCTAFEIARITGIQRLVNAAITGGANIVRQLTTIPVKTGFDEYEEKMGSVQTIISSTGESIETVKSALEKLNAYADRTIYKFQDMTSNIGKFTNAGVELGTAVDAIRGISNVAAISGANASEASRAMYNLAQSLSSGYVKLLDWKSIELANMATKSFKENLLEAAAAQGTLRKESKGVYKTLKGNSVTATRNFNETLQEQWLTSEVLIKTLRNYADETTEVGKKAYAAAQDVKTLSMLFDTFKEAVQSGWSSAWELIIGDFEEAKEFFTSVSNSLGGVIGKLSDARNYLLMGGLSKQSNNWKKITNAVNRAGISTDEFNKSLIETGRLYVANLDEIISSSGSFEESLSKGWLNSDIISETFGKFNEALSQNLGKYTEEQQKIIQELYSQSREKGSIVQNLIGNMDKYGASSGRELLLSGVINMFTATIKFIKAVSAGINSAFGKVNSKTIYDLSKRFNEFTQSLILSDEKFDKIARTVRGVATVFKFVSDILKTVFTFALKSVCGLLGIAGNNILDLTAGLGDFITKAIGSIKANKTLKDLLSTIGTIIKGIVALFARLFKSIRNNKKITKTFNAVLRFVTKFLKDSSEYFVGFLDVLFKWIDSLKELDGFSFDNLGKAFKSLQKNVLGYLFDFNGAFKRSGETIGKLSDKIKNLFSQKGSGIKKNSIYSVLSKIFTWVFEYISGRYNEIKKFIKSGNTKSLIFSIISIFFVNRLLNILEKISVVFGAASSGIRSFASIATEISFSLQRLSKGISHYLNANALLKVAIAIGIFVASLTALSFVPYEKLKSALPIFAKLAAMFLGLNIIMTIINKIGASPSKIGGLLATLTSIVLFVKAMSYMTVKLDEMASMFEKWIKPIEEAKSSIETLKALGKQLAKLGVAIGLAIGAVSLFSIFMKALYSAKDASLKGAIGISLMLLTASLFIKKFIPMMNELYSGLLSMIEKLMIKTKDILKDTTGWEKTGIIGALIIISGALIGSLIVLNKLLSKLHAAVKPAIGMVLQITLSLVALWLSVKLWSTIDFKKSWPAILGIGGTIAALTTAVILIGKNLKDQEKFPKIGKALLSMAAAILVMVAAISILSYVASGNESAFIEASASVAGIILALSMFVSLAKEGTFKGISSAIFKIGIGIALVIAGLIWLSSKLNDQNKTAITKIAKWAGIVAIVASVVWMIVKVMDTFKTLNKKVEKVKTVGSPKTPTKSSTKSNSSKGPVSKTYEGVWQTLIAFGTLVAEISGLIYAFATNIKGKEAWGRVALATGVILAVIVAVSFCLKQITRLGAETETLNGNNKSKTGFSTKAMAAIISLLVGLSYLVYMIIPIAQLPVANIIAAGSVIAGISLFIGILIQMLYHVPKNVGSMTKNRLISLGILISGIILIIGSLRLLASEDMSSIISSGTMIILILGEIAAIYAIFGKMPKNSGGKNATTMAVAFIEMASAIVIISMALRMAASINSGQITTVAAAISAVTIVIATIIGLFSLMKDSTSMLSAATSFVIMAAGVLVIAGALTTLTKLGNSDGIIKVATSLSIVIGIVSGMIAIFSLLSAGQMILGAVSFDIMTIGILVIAAALEKLGVLDPEKLRAAAEAISVVTLIMVALSAALGALEVLTGGIGALAVVAGIASLAGIAGVILIIANSIEKVANSYDKLRDATAMLPTLIKAFRAELSEMIGSVSDKAETAYESAYEVITGFSDGIMDGIIDTMPSLQTVIANAFNSVNTQITKEINKILTNIANKEISFKTTGVYLVEGLRSGMTGMENQMYKTMERIAGNVITTLNNTVQVRSPSRLTMDTGMNMGKGFINGMDSQQKNIYLSGFSSGISALAGFGDAAGLAPDAGSKAFTSGMGIKDIISSGKSSNNFSLSSLGDVIKKTITDIFGEKELTGKDTIDVYSEKYYKLNAKEQYKIDNIADNINKIIKNQPDKHSFMSSITQSSMAKKPMATKDELRSYLTGSYNKYINADNSLDQSWAIESAVRYIKDNTRGSISYDDLKYFWATMGSALPQLVNPYTNAYKDEDLSTVTGAGDFMNSTIFGDDFDIKKYFEDIFKENEEVKNNTQGILDSTNETNSILGSAASSEKSYTFVQNNYSPKALSTIEIYRQTNNQLSKLARKGW